MMSFCEVQQLRDTLAAVEVAHGALLCELTSLISLLHTAADDGPYMWPYMLCLYLMMGFDNGLLSMLLSGAVHKQKKVVVCNLCSLQNRSF